MNNSWGNQNESDTWLQHKEGREVPSDIVGGSHLKANSTLEVLFWQQSAGCDL